MARAEKKEKKKEEAKSNKTWVSNTLHHAQLKLEAAVIVLNISQQGRVKDSSKMVLVQTHLCH